MAETETTGQKMLFNNSDLGKYRDRMAQLARDCREAAECHQSALLIAPTIAKIDADASELMMLAYINKAMPDECPTITSTLYRIKDNLNAAGWRSRRRSDLLRYYLLGAAGELDDLVAVDLARGKGGHHG